MDPNSELNRFFILLQHIRCFLKSRQHRATEVFQMYQALGHFVVIKFGVSCNIVPSLSSICFCRILLSPQTFFLLNLIGLTRPDQLESWFEYRPVKGYCFGFWVWSKQMKQYRLTSLTNNIYDERHFLGFRVRFPPLYCPSLISSC